MKRSIGFVVFGLSLSVANPAHPQTGAFGLGPRVTFQSGSEAVPDSSFRIFGGQLKLRLNPSTAIEVSADYESELNESLTQRVKTMPVQASLLVYMSRSRFAPYLLGGMGWYRHSLTQEGATETSAAVTTTVRQTGYHAGLGAELRLGRHMAIHGDYRYKYIRSGETEADVTSDAPSSGVTSAPASAAIVPGLTSLRESLKLSQQGTMWNWGMTFFF
jgi:opacity protein-like surface antigen